MDQIKKYWKPVSLTVLILIAVVLISSFVFFNPSEPDMRTATASVGSFDISINTIGSLDTERSHIVSSAMKGDKGKIIFLVDDGSLVKKGDLLVRFDTSQLENDILRLSGELKGREAAVEARKQVLEWEKSQAEGAVRNAEFDLRDSRREYSRYLSYIKDLEELSKKGFHYSNEIAQAQKKAEQLDNKRQKYETSFDQLQKESVFKIASAAAEREKAQSEREATRAALEDARSELRKATIYAPFSGIVVHYELFRDNQKRKPRVGDTAWQNQPLLYLPDISSMIVRTQVREVDLHKISKGQNAVIQVDAYPDLRFSGRVESIGVLAADNPEQGRGEKNFQMIVSVNGEDARLRPGMTSRVTVRTGTVNTVLSVPIQAVFNEAGKMYCYVYKRDLRKQEVMIGRYNEDRVEIVSGLKEGEKISLVKPSTGE